MDDGEVGHSDPVYMPNSGTHSDNIQGRSTSVDSILDEYMKHTKTCIHSHSCNPPGPDTAHTHTCYHTHTQVFSSEEDVKPFCNDPSLKPKKPVGNREAVRKYREKKKAQTAFLEEEVRKLQVLNQHLVRKLQGQAALEAEFLRLKALLVGLRGKIDAEFGSFPFQRACSSSGNISFKGGGSGSQSVRGEAISLQCPTQVQPFDSTDGGDGVRNPVFSWQDNCQPATVDCRVNENGTAGASDHSFEAVESLFSAKNQRQ